MNISTNVFKRCEIVLNSNKAYDNPFMDVDIDAVFTHEDGTVITLPGFWNGGNEWKVRFSAEKAGKWTYEVTCTDKENASLCDTGVIDAQPCEPKTELEKHGYVTIKEGSRYLTYADGTPFFYLADTHWQMPDYERLHECNYPGCTCGNQFKHLVDDRVKKGFTAYQTYFDSSNTDGGGNPYLHLWWEDRTYTKINPQSFNETMDVMIEYLTEQGLVTALGFGVHTNTIAAFKTVEPLLRFARYCVARYACYPILWFTAQEIIIDGHDSLNKYRQAGELVGKLDGYHRPNGAHLTPVESDDPRVVAIDNDPWHQLWFLQAGHGGFDGIKSRYFYQSYYNNEKVKPYLETECHYEDLGSNNDHDSSRIGAWQAILSGCAGFTYGVTGIWAMRWSFEKKGWTGYSPEPWYIGMDKPGSQQMKYFRDFFEYVNWSKLTPSFDHEFGAFDMRKHIAISHIDKDLIIFYFFAKDNERGSLLNLKKNVRYQARWYDPVTGKFIDLDDIITETGEYPIPKKPSLRDWVLLLNTYDLGEYETAPYPNMPSPVAPKDIPLGDEIIPVKLKASSEDPEHPITNIMDGNPETYWAPYDPRTCQTIDFEFEKEEDVRYIRFESNNPSFYYLRYRVFGSSDGENYDLICERPTKLLMIGGNYPFFHDHLFANKKYRYVRVFFNTFDLGASKRQFVHIGIFKKPE